MIMSYACQIILLTLGVGEGEEEKSGQIRMRPLFKQTYKEQFGGIVSACGSE